MREELLHRQNERHTYSGSFVRFGKSRDNRRTMLLVNVCCNDRHIAQHVWLDEGKLFWPLHLRHGDVVRFSAVAYPYRRNYDGERDDVHDFHLRCVQDVEVISRARDRLVRQMPHMKELSCQ